MNNPYSNQTINKIDNRQVNHRSVHVISNESMISIHHSTILKVLNLIQINQNIESVRGIVN